MAETRKPEYCFTPDALEEDEETLEKSREGEGFVEEGECFELDFEDFQARRWPGDTFDC